MSMDLWLWLILILMLSVVIAQNIGLKERLKKLDASFIADPRARAATNETRADINLKTGAP